MTRIAAIGLLLVFTSMAWGQEAATEQPQEGAASAVKETATTQEQPAGPPTPNYSGDLMHRRALTGDWGGFRNDLAAMGITLDVGVTQIIQGNAHGGADTKNAFRYSGSTDYTLTLDTGKMGLWPGGTLLLNAETKWGDGIQRKVGALMPVNLDAYKPGFGEGCMMTLSEWIMFQALFEGKVVLVAGKLDGSRAFDRNVFANDERTQFMNAALRNNMIIPTFLPYTNLGAGVVLNPFDWLSIVTAVADTEGQAKTTGFETTFHGPTHTTVIHEWDVKVKPFGLPGNQRVGFVWSSKEFPELQPISPFKETGPFLLSVVGPKIFNNLAKLLPYEHKNDNVGVYYNFDQYLYTEKDDPTQGIGMFGRFGWARQDVNPVAHFYSIGVGGKGVLPDRDRDTFGVGYYFVDLSNDMPYWFHSEQGIECYYNVEITPWLHISPDLQVIVNPGGTSANDVSIVYGFRMQMNL
ncbi:MAG: carbohydrate porin [Planctomycetes bacterium]|nr:carbohydrate porin [Planctomycetota bacterium]